MDRPDGRKAALQVFGAPTPDFSLPCPELSYWPSSGRAARNLAISTRMSAKSVVRGPNRKAVSQAFQLGWGLILRPRSTGTTDGTLNPSAPIWKHRVF